MILSPNSQALLTDFTLESLMSLAPIEHSLRKLETITNSSTWIQDVYRTVHNIKGGAGFLGLKNIVSLCHALESAVQQLKETQGESFTTQAQPLALSFQQLKLAIQHCQDQLKVDSKRTETPLPLFGRRSQEQNPAGLARGRRAEDQLNENTIRVETEQLDSVLRYSDELLKTLQLLAVIRTKLARQINDPQLLPSLEKTLIQLEDQITLLQMSVLKTRQQNINQWSTRFVRMTSDLAQYLGKSAQMVILGGDIEIDRSLGDALSPAILQLIRNAIDHGLTDPITRQSQGKSATGLITLKCSLDRDILYLVLSDDCEGLDGTKLKEIAIEAKITTIEKTEQMNEQEIHNLVFLPGITTKTKVSEISGRGVGLDVVKNQIEALGGSVSVSSSPHNGTHFTLEVPFEATWHHPTHDSEVAF